MLKLLLALLFTLGVATAALAERRLALVIGNGAYSMVAPLDNPVNDARSTAARLEETGFEVMLLIDADQAGMKRGIVEFGRRLRALGPDATGLFYYAGHGVQSQGRNFLLPVDSAISHPADLDIVGVEAQWVLRQMYSARNDTNIVILDACRDNPFGPVDGMSDQGLAEMNAPAGTFISYATEPGGVAADGIGENSPFTAALIDAMAVPGAPIEEVFKAVRRTVHAQTGGLQTPWDSSSLITDFFFVPAVTKTAEELAQEQLWNSVRDSRDPVQIVLYLRAHPDSPYAAEAAALLTEAIAAEVGAEADARPVAEAAPQAPGAAQDVGATAAIAGPIHRGPDAAETALIDRARRSGLAEDYTAYLDAYPTGTFADLARAELSALAPPAPQTDTAALAAPATAPPTPDPAAAAVVRFDAPLVVGDAAVLGRTLEQLIEGSPLHPPIAGLPRDAWADQTCSGCHAWTRDDLCEQAQFYLAENAARSLAKPHPYGGSFKRSLRAWAEGGCQ